MSSDSTTHVISFSGDTPGRTHNEVNKWLEEHADVTVISHQFVVAYQLERAGFYISLLYTRPVPAPKDDGWGPEASAETKNRVRVTDSPDDEDETDEP